MSKQSYVNGPVKCLLTTCNVCALFYTGERSAWDSAHVCTVCVKLVIYSLQSRGGIASTCNNWNLIT